LCQQEATPLPLMAVAQPAAHQTTLQAMTTIAKQQRCVVRRTWIASQTMQTKKTATTTKV
jgi:hypothetical protein